MYCLFLPACSSNALKLHKSYLLKLSPHLLQISSKKGVLLNIIVTPFVKRFNGNNEYHYAAFCLMISSATSRNTCSAADEQQPVSVFLSGFLREFMPSGFYYITTFPAMQHFFSAKKYSSHCTILGGRFCAG
mgnify:FL=1